MNWPVKHVLPAALLVPGCLPRRLPPISLDWYPATPRTVVMHVACQMWKIDLQLLHDGLTGPAGKGDVFVCPVPQDTPGIQIHEIVLDNGEQQCAIQVATADLEAFADRVEEAVEKWQATT